MAININKIDGESLRNRILLEQISGIKSADGDDVKLTRIIGSSKLNMLDPFLLLDAFESNDANDYIGGFPMHPHRGFETVTYLFAGRMRHKDNAGHEGVIEAGGVQWMTAAKGIIHSEMPEQEQGLLKGLQLWVNLPSWAKMKEPTYQEYSPELIPLERRENGTEIRVISGKTSQGTLGPVKNKYTDPIYFDIKLPANIVFSQSLPTDYNAFIYVLEDDISILEAEHDMTQALRMTLNAKKLGVLSKGQQIEVQGGNKGSHFILIAGKPLNEPVARGGPFVMNTKEEIVQAFSDYKNGRF